MSVTQGAGNTSLNQAQNHMSEGQQETISLSQAINQTKYTPGTGGDGSEELMHRIDLYVGELTRLWESLEITYPNVAVNNSMTFQAIF